VGLGCSDLSAGHPIGGFDNHRDSYWRLRTHPTIARITGLETKPVVILLYNPAGYEIYRDILVDRQPEYDQVSEFQIGAQKAFAEANGWRFINLTGPLRTKLDKNKFWIYGRHDSNSLVPAGPAFVAKAMAEELRKVMAQ
jgi:hypothetical protein